MVSRASCKPFVNLMARTGALSSAVSAICKRSNQGFSNGLSPRKPIKGFHMSKERENKAIADRWLEGFWGNSWTPNIVDDLAAVDILIQFSLQMPRRGQAEAKRFMIGIRDAFHDLEFHSTADLVAEGDYVTGCLEGGGAHTGSAFTDLLIGFFPAHSGRKMHLTGKTVLRIKNGKIVEDMTRMTWATELPRIRKAAA